MKTLILFLTLAVASVGLAQFPQTEVSITPAISTTKIDSIVVTVNSKTVYSVTKPFSGITAGMQIESLRFPMLTTVVSNTNDSVLVLSNPATATVALDTMWFPTFTSAAYAAGDALGFPFEVPLTHEIDGVIVTDAAKQITSVKLVFFRDLFTQSFDNAAFSPSDADAANIIGYALADSSTVLPNNNIVYRRPDYHPVYLGVKHVYCQLVCLGTPTFTAVSNLKVHISGQ